MEAEVVQPYRGRALLRLSNHQPLALARPPVTLPLTWLDQAVPLLEWTVWPYLVFAGCIFLPLLLTDRQVFRQCLAALGCGYSVNLLISQDLLYTRRGEEFQEQFVRANLMSGEISNDLLDPNPVQVIQVATETVQTIAALRLPSPTLVGKRQDRVERFGQV